MLELIFLITWLFSIGKKKKKKLIFLAFTAKLVLGNLVFVRLCTTWSHNSLHYLGHLYVTIFHYHCTELDYIKIEHLLADL